MTPGIEPLLAGNWKMNGLRASLSEIRALAAGLVSAGAGFETLICPPATLLREAVLLCGNGPVRLGAQDCHPAPAGAFTGDISAAMIADSGATHVIVGHSERRVLGGEDDALVRAKAQAAHAAGLVAIVCIGETEEQRRGGTTLDVLARQLASSVPDGARAADTVIAYEPVWAIGTGLTPTPADVAEAHAFMRKTLAARFGEDGRRMRILYGGSVKPSNAEELLAIENVDGALVGGASLSAKDFLAIAKRLGGIAAAAAAA